MLSGIQQELRRGSLTYGTLFAVLPLMLGLAVGPLVGFGPCGPSVPSPVRLIVIAAGTLAIASPLISSWLFWISFRRRKSLTALMAFPLLSVGVLVCLYWLFILLSAGRGYKIGTKRSASAGVVVVCAAITRGYY